MLASRGSTLFFALVSALAAACGGPGKAGPRGFVPAEWPLYKSVRPLAGRQAMVVSGSPLASRVGADILRKGGNAVDAAVAVGFALAVVHPEAGNLGGGGYMVLRLADGRAAAIDYRETAPAVAKPGFFKDDRERRIGYKASAVPGTVAGLALAHRTYGVLPWKTVLEPARRLASKGFPASQRLELILRLQVP